MIRRLAILLGMLSACFDGPGRPRPGDVWISEVVTAGETDWIELENRTDRPFDLDGIWVSDSESKLMRHQLPGKDRLVIVPRGHLVLTADGDSARGPLHLPFSLSKAGEPVSISTRDGTPIDRVSVPPMKAGQSFARLGEQLIVCGTPTPGASNACGEEAPILTD